MDVDARLVEGVREFNAGNFYEAHELFEAVWDELVGPDKEVCQALVQIAAGYHKLALGGVNGARKLLARGIALLSQSDPAALGLDLRPFEVGVADDLSRLRHLPFGAGADLSVTHVPALRFRNG